MKVTETPAAFQAVTEIPAASLMVRISFHPTREVCRNT